jgi:hypothetical protein
LITKARGRPEPFFALSASFFLPPERSFARSPYKSATYGGHTLALGAAGHGENIMNDQFFEMDETDQEEELLAFDHEDEAGDQESELGITAEDREIELAAELLGVSDEQELNEFFGNLLKGARSMLASPAGQKLKALLRQTAKSALAPAGEAIGGYFGGERGAAFGGKVAAAGGQLFGLELEGLSPEDRELQIARRYVRLASEALRRLSNAPSGNPTRVAETAFFGAARRHAPGIAARLNGGYGYNSASRPSSRPLTGRWIRKTGKIYVLGL